MLFVLLSFWMVINSCISISSYHKIKAIFTDFRQSTIAGVQFAGGWRYKTSRIYIATTQQVTKDTNGQKGVGGQIEA